MRTHLILSDELVEQVDALVGKRKRSNFAEIVIREAVRKQKLLEAIDKSFGTVSAEAVPE